MAYSASFTCANKKASPTRRQGRHKTMLDGGQQKWEAIEQVIRMDQSAVVVRLPESSTVTL